MIETFKVSILRYWLAMNASALDAGVHAVNIFCGVAGVSVVTSDISPLTLKQGALVFLIAFGKGILGYLTAHPISDLLKSSTNNSEPNNQPQ